MQKQVKQHSGVPFDYNIDSHTFKAMSDIQELFRARGFPCSQSVIARRAIRLYGRHLARVLEEALFDQEEIEVQRAAKGII